MKKALFIFAFALLCIFSFGQTIHKGSLMGVHILTPTLKEGVTMEEYTNFCTHKWIPEVEKAFPGAKAYLLKSVRGQDSSSLGIIVIFKNEAERNKYWKSAGTMTAAGQAANQKLADAIGQDAEKYAVLPYLDKYNDWLVL
ncbi:hypothetical protein QEG73_04400 [Chitinophagaceae bacterium 26-R-25]|nr:hypothetical protein [Chitinophagaceae bacterium 26-R-25]